MNRVHNQPIAEAVGIALDYFPPRLRSIAETADLCLGADPIFSGLHSIEDTGDGRAYRDTAHVCFPWHSTDRSLTVVMPTAADGPHWLVHTALHEFAHAIDLRLRERFGRWPPAFRPVCAYAAKNRCEAFACALHSWLLAPAYAAEQMPGWCGYDPESRAWFDRLARGDE